MLPLRVGDDATDDAPGQFRNASEARRRRRVGMDRDLASCLRCDRDKVLGKTGGRCHICGRTIDADDWQADHILAHSTGGAHLVENYLPAHSICNNYRWHYDAEEFKWILKLGIWLRTQIEKGTTTSQKIGQKFCEHERRRSGRP